MANVVLSILLPNLLPNMSAERRTKNGGPELANTLPPEEVLFGRSEAMKDLRKRATKIAATNIPLLLCGPKGSGKEVLACWIHNHSAVRSEEHTSELQS